MAESRSVSTLSPLLLKKAEEELGEKASTRSDIIIALRNKIISNKGLKIRIDDAFLLRFLRARKFDVDKAYDLLINYITLRMEKAEILKEVNPKALASLLDMNMSMVLPKKTPEGCSITYFAPGKWDPEICPLLDVVRLTILSMEQAVMDEEAQINGMVSIGDFGEFGMNHVKNFDREFPKLQSSLLQDAFPLREKQIHMVNEPGVFGTIFALMKPFLKPKFLERMHFHGGNLDSLHKYVSPDLLPEELGGTLGTTKQLAEDWRKKMESNQKNYEEIQQFSLEINRNITKTVVSDHSDIHGVSGTFKKLNVD